MHTALVIAVFAAMVLSPCVVASFPRLFGSSQDEDDPRAEPNAATKASPAPPSRRG